MIDKWKNILGSTLCEKYVRPEVRIMESVIMEMMILKDTKEWYAEKEDDKMDVILTALQRQKKSNEEEGKVTNEAENGKERSGKKQNLYKR